MTNVSFFMEEKSNLQFKSLKSGKKPKGNNPKSSQELISVDNSVAYHLEISAQFESFDGKIRDDHSQNSKEVIPSTDSIIEDDPKLQKLLNLLRTISEDAADKLEDILSKVDKKSNSKELDTFADKLTDAINEIQNQTKSTSTSRTVKVRFDFYMEDKKIIADGEIAAERARDAKRKKEDPLVIDLDGDGIELTKMENGVNFDINGDGKIDKTAFVKPDDGLLALDKNGNGVIDSGKELFGTQNGASDGFSELGKYDENGDGKIDKNDAIYYKLRVWQDLNQNGKSEEGELNSLETLKIDSINLRNRKIVNEDINGNLLREYGTYESSGKIKNMGEAFFNYSKLA